MGKTVNGLSKPIDRPKAHLTLNHIESAPNWEIARATRRLFKAGLKLHHERQDKAWSLTDCISFVVMRRQSIQTALTSDHHFEQAGFDALLRRNP
jgi:predicted nucleic acid-binding protein